MGMSSLISLALMPYMGSAGVRSSYLALGVVFSSMLLVIAVVLPPEGDRLVLEAPAGSGAGQAGARSEEADEASGRELGRAKSRELGKVMRLYAVFLVDMLGLYFWEAQFQVILEDTQPETSPALRLGAPVLFVLCALSRVGWGVAATYKPAVVCMAAASLMLSASFVLWALGLGGLPLTFLGLALTSTSMASHIVLMPVLVLRTASPESATFLYAVLMTAEIGGVSAPLSAGMSKVAGWRLTLLLCAAVPAGNALVKLLALEWDRPASKAEASKTSEDCKAA